jgi:hypothetical protein
MQAYCLKCHRQVDQPKREVLVKATEARLAGKIVHFECPNKNCKGMVVGVQELVEPSKIPGPIKMFDHTPPAIEVMTKRGDEE